MVHKCRHWRRKGDETDDEQDGGRGPGEAEEADEEVPKEEDG